MLYLKIELVFQQVQYHKVSQIPTNSHIGHSFTLLIPLQSSTAQVVKYLQDRKKMSNYLANILQNSVVAFISKYIGFSLPETLSCKWGDRLSYPLCAYWSCRIQGLRLFPSVYWSSDYLRQNVARNLCQISPR